MRDHARTWFAVALLLLVVAGPTLAVERFESTLTAEESLPDGASLNLENLIGSLTIRGDRTDGVARVEARVVVEAESRSEAQSITEAIRLDSRTEGSIVSIRVDYPVDRFTAFKLPRSEKSGLLSKWVTPLLRKSTVATVYGGNTVEVGQGRGALPVAVHLTVTLPLDVNASLKQVVGTTHAVGVRGRVGLEVIEGEIVAEQVYGSLRIRTGGGDVTVRKFSGDSFHAQTGSGRMQLMELQAEEATVISGSGNVEGSGITAAALHVENGSGSVLLQDLDSVAFQVSTGSGPVDLAARITRTREASIQTATGNVTLRVSRSTPFELLAEAAAGSVKYRDLSAEVLEEQKNLVRMQRGEGGAALRVSTEKGEVLVRPI